MSRAAASPPRGFRACVMCLRHHRCHRPRPPRLLTSAAPSLPHAPCLAVECNTIRGEFFLGGQQVVCMCPSCMAQPSDQERTFSATKVITQSRSVWKQPPHQSFLPSFDPSRIGVRRPFESTSSLPSRSCCSGRLTWGAAPPRSGRRPSRSCRGSSLKCQEEVSRRLLHDDTRCAVAAVAAAPARSTCPRARGHPEPLNPIPCVLPALPQ